MDSIDELVSIGIPDGRDYIVEGTAAGDLITGTYTGDPEGDMVDNNDAADGSNDDVIYGYDGDDIIQSGAGDDTIFGGTGNDQLYGGDGADSLDGGAGGDDLYSGLGDDTILGGDGADSIFASSGADSIDAGVGDDTIRFTDADSVSGGDGDDRFQADALVLYGSPISITGGEGVETRGDTLSSGTYSGDVTVDLTAGGTAADPESGTMQLGTPTVTFGEIESVETGSGNESIIGSTGNDNVSTGTGADTVDGGAGDDIFDLGAGDGAVDTVVFSDGDGSDTVAGFDAPTDLGCGSYSGNDQLDVSGLTDLSGNPVNVDDVTVSGTNGDGTGDAILSFPNGESITLTGVLPGAVSDPAALVAMGIPAAGGDYIVEGTAGADLINTAYAGDPEGDMIDNSDHSDGSDDDSVVAGDGDDSIDAGAGDDTILGGAGDDEFFLDGSIQNDSIVGGETGEDGPGDRINFSTVADDITINFSAAETGTLSDGVSTTTFEEIEEFQMGTGNDSVVGSDGAQDIIGNYGDDTIFGGGGDDLLQGGGLSDTDVFIGGAGSDTMVDTGGDGYFGFADGFGNDSVVGGESGETLGDTLDFQGLTHWDDITYTNTDPGVGGGLSGSAVLADGSVVTFSEIENVIICFTAGTRIATARGLCEVQELRPGDMVVTRDHGLQPVRWVGRRTVPAKGRLAPIRFEAGVLGNDRPILVSPQHRMLIQGGEVSLNFGESEVLAAAKHLVNGGSVVKMPGGDVTYVHVFFDQHEVIYAEGAASESFFPGDSGLDAVDPAARDELFTVFPELRSSVGSYGDTARMCLRGRESRLLRLS
ncbi:Hint domain-containing protein [Marimonas lutisalis]|uniref:Hint domain-containing protein n=1 Tax=Marimonas lutisalis TaxID=2545756 RepID=UPI0010FA127E|nr:Hint domain-containing protein [Marimonas lutisalis]